MNSRRLLFLVALLAAAPALADPIPISAAPIELRAGDDTAQRIGKLSWRGTIQIASPDARFGGLSGLEVAPDGALVSATDLGFWFTFRPVLSPEGRLVGAGNGDLTPMADERGKPFIGKRQADAESLRRDSTGGYLVSFEREHRVLRYARIGGPGLPVATPPEIARQPENGGIEAVAAWTDGRILLLSERARDDKGDGWGWLRAQGTWSAITLAVGPEYQPTDAVALFNDDLLVLQRRYMPALISQGAKIVRVPAGQIVPNGRLSGETVAEWEAPFVVDNMEGLAVSRAPDGGTLVWVVSDDNQNPLQRTLLMLFRLD